MKSIKGYLTVYASLIFMVLVGLWAALCEGVRIKTFCLKCEADVKIATDSVMAEYNRKLFEDFDILALDSSYMTEYASSDNVASRLEYYMSKRSLLWGEYLKPVKGVDFGGITQRSAEITKICSLCDDEGGVFIKCAVDSIKDKLDAGLCENIFKDYETLTLGNVDYEDGEDNIDAVDAEIESLYEKEDFAEYRGDSIEGNPIRSLKGLKVSGITSLLVDNRDVSKLVTNKDNLVSERIRRNEVTRGNMNLTLGKDNRISITDRIIFSQYLLEHMKCFTSPVDEEKKSLRYELEYIIGGMASDKDNLTKTVRRLLLLRIGLNGAAIKSDPVMQAKVDEAVLANPVCDLFPEVFPIFKEATELAWCYAESLYDVKALLKGKKIELKKTSSQWHYSLSGVLKGMVRVDDVNESEGNTGLKYNEYLRLLLLLKKSSDLCYRSMDMVEARIRTYPGNTHFKLDGCFAAIGVNVSFHSRYGYGYSVTRKDKYLRD
ncbi:MAG: DUF5702 domain-containing protein [Lachnospiraceae bacterium]|nr:DUF5702 domain-containing protein [Lachnospiraceae bacterium]